MKLTYLRLRFCKLNCRHSM